ncbi:hypothetical protein BS78_K224400 [Paspalum vaginatum]|uniref:Uncharacterized protein n=1 Tax=Paspalum vaginatum TaxID=158149 RepID=A0A9W7XDT2_9POAL|nr:hypothetical protein BS78_K224400 [Paspalum vaginatum]
MNCYATPHEHPPPLTTCYGVDAPRRRHATMLPTYLDGFIAMDQAGVHAACHCIFLRLCASLCLSLTPGARCPAHVKDSQYPRLRIPLHDILRCKECQPGANDTIVIAAVDMHCPAAAR